ncbi:MAG TPA: choice-of-anchor tandem repeat NxxGxxAF-containing protein [Vicinamibacterales bacterium]
MLKHVIASGAAALLLLAGPPAQAGQPRSANYRFTTVLDSLRDGLEPTRCAAVDARGTVAVQVHDPALDINKLVTKRGARDAPVVVAHTERVADYPTSCDNGITQITSNPSINARGEVAFQVNLRRVTATERLECQTPEQQDTPRQGVFLGKGGPLTTIAHTNNPPGGEFISEFVVADGSVNSRGEVALAIELDNSGFDQGLFTGSKRGTFDERFRNSTSEFDAPSSAMSINEIGQIAFQDNGIVLSDPDGTITRIVDSNAGDFVVFDPSLNIFGRVAFTGSFFVGDTQVHGIFTSRGGLLTTVADSTGPYSSFAEPSLNDLARVVFTADLDELGPNGFPIQGVFTGPDPVTDKVLQAGDRYAGVPVSSVFTCTEALNNRGQIVMTVQSENPDTFEVRTFIVKATPRRRP